MEYYPVRLERENTAPREHLGCKRDQDQQDMVQIMHSLQGSMEKLTTGLGDSLQFSHSAKIFSLSQKEQQLLESGLEEHQNYSRKSKSKSKCHSFQEFQRLANQAQHTFIFQIVTCSDPI